MDHVEEEEVHDGGLESYCDVVRASEEDHQKMMACSWTPVVAYSPAMVVTASLEALNFVVVVVVVVLVTVLAPRECHDVLASVESLQAAALRLTVPSYLQRAIHQAFHHRLHSVVIPSLHYQEVVALSFLGAS